MLEPEVAKRPEVDSRLPKTVVCPRSLSAQRFLTASDDPKGFLFDCTYERDYPNKKPRPDD